MATTKNAFDAIAKPKTTATAKAKIKVAAVVSDPVREAVDQVILLKAKEAAIEAERKQAEDVIRACVAPQQDELGFHGNFAGSLTVEGHDGEVLYVASDRFICPKEEDAQEELKKLLGAKFEELFEYRRTITLKKEAAEDKKLIEKLQAALEKGGFTLADAFDVADVLAAKPGLLEAQYKLSESKLTSMRTLVRQYAPGIKPVASSKA